ncbi:hypothetical protein TNCV_3016131 [Trichonephila clavipes]|nr:hypothetical protein TNCV_3016131 [Trichonephila clavipes]
MLRLRRRELRFIRLNQTKLRAEDYGVLLEAVRNDNNVTSENPGKLVVLPSSFTGEPGYKHECTQNGMTYVRHYANKQLYASTENLILNPGKAGYLQLVIK